jgi:pantetheine-phosphate adenylyltransferase
MKKIALFPGSFDPITLGHYDIIQRALPLFDKIIIGVGVNSSKKYLFDLPIRENWIKECFKNNNKIEIINYSGLTVEVCKQNNINFILRGLRTTNDFDFERAIAHINHSLEPSIETVFLLTSQEYASISSSIVRDIILNGGDASIFLPPAVKINK